MKATLLKAVVCVTLVFASVLNTKVMAQGNFITNDVMTGEQVTSKIIYRHDGALYRHMKHDFTYDDQNRIIGKETFKWDNRKEEWMPYCKVSFTYSADQVVMDYAKWNKKDKAYNEATERSIYELDGFSVPVAYQNYKWDNKYDNWKIVDNMMLQPSRGLFAFSK